jgi:hypothetical protein
MTDLNTFLSTCIETAGVIVAIIGGLLVTRIVALQSKREGLRESILRVQERLDSSVEQQQRLKAQAVQDEEEHFCATILTDVIMNSGFPKNKALISRNEYAYLNADRQMVLIHSIRKAVQTAFQRISRLSHAELAQSDFDNAQHLIPKGIPAGQQALYREVFFEISYRVGVEAKSSNGSSYLRPDRPGGRISHQVLEAYDCMRIVAELAKTEEITLMFEKELERFRTQLQELARPKGLLRLWLILLYLSVVGVAFPLVLLPAGSGDEVFRAPILALMLTGFGLMLLYFAVALFDSSSIRSSGALLWIARILLWVVAALVSCVLKPILWVFLPIEVEQLVSRLQCRIQYRTRTAASASDTTCNPEGAFPEPGRCLSGDFLHRYLKRDGGER